MKIRQSQHSDYKATQKKGEENCAVRLCSCVWVFVFCMSICEVVFFPCVVEELFEFVYTHLPKKKEKGMR